MLTNKNEKMYINRRRKNVLVLKRSEILNEPFIAIIENTPATSQNLP